MKLNFSIRKTDRSKNEAHTFLTIRFAVSYSLFLFVILLLMVYLHHVSTKNANEEFWDQNKSAFQSAVSFLNSDLSILDSYCRQLSQDSRFRRLSRMTDASGSDFFLSGLHLKQTLSAHLYSYTHLPVNSYFVYLRNTRYVASVNAFTYEKLYYMHNYKTSWRDFSNLDLWRDLIYASNKEGTMYPLGSFVASGSDDAYLYLINMNALTYRNIPATAGFHISYDKLKHIFSGVSLGSTGCILALDSQNAPAFMVSEAPTLHENEAFCDSRSLAADLSALPFSNGYASYRMNGTDMHVTYLSSGVSGLQYYLLQPQSLCPEKYQSFFTLFLLLAAAFGLGLIFLLVHGSMRPILQLDTALKETITDRNQLKEVVEAARPIIYSTYLRQLMTGSLSSPDELNYIQSFLHLGNPDLNYYVMYGVAYENDLVEAAELAEGNDSSSRIIYGVLAQYFSYHNTLYLFSPEKRIYALLLPFEGDGQKALISIQEKVLDIHETLLEQYSIWFFTGIGLPCSFHNIWESYQQAKDASGYTSKNYIFLPYEMLKKNSHVYYYPADFSSRMISFITAGNYPQVAELFHLIYQENIEERSLSLQLLKFLLTDIRNTLLKARFSVTCADGESEELAEIDALFSKEDLTFRYCEDIALKLCVFFQKKSEKQNLIDHIVAYIRDNYKDPSLGLNKISDEFHISESYFSHMFKEKMHINFSVYLEDLRLNEAARLIKEGSFNLTGISVEVGYNNVTSFRRAFKKKFGMTPSAMASQ